MKTLVALATAAAAIAFAAPAGADTYHFVLTSTDPTFPDETADFYLDSSPTPDIAIPGVGFGIYDVPGTYTYGSSTSDIDSLYFYNADAVGYFGNSGGFFTGDLLITAGGEQLYSGDETAPTFLTGTFDLTDFLTGQPLSLTISDTSTPPPPGVPEPASWAMMIAGFGLTGAAMRRRTARVSYAV